MTSANQIYPMNNPPIRHPISRRAALRVSLTALLTLLIGRIGCTAGESKARGPRLTVVPLTWRDCTCPWLWMAYYEDEMRYHIIFSNGKGPPHPGHFSVYRGSTAGFGSPSVASGIKTLGQAMAVAHADWERRIRSAVRLG